MNLLVEDDTKFRQFLKDLLNTTFSYSTQFMLKIKRLELYQREIV